MFGFKKWRRNRVRNRPFPKDWVEIIRKNAPYYSLLTPEEQTELHGCIQIFLDEKHFEGCNGQEITDEIRLTIAANACFLILNRETDYYPNLQTILVYPTEFQVEETYDFEDGTVIEESDVRLGESWVDGVVVLSWEDVWNGPGNWGEGFNLTIHEFAHQLDSESGDSEGAPELVDRELSKTWREVFSREYEKLIDDLKHRRPTFLEEYAATDPAEFFAILTECFFEVPIELEEEHPELYDLMKTYYRQDPASRKRAASAPPEAR